MKLFARTIEDLGQKFVAVDLPEHVYELCFVEDGAEPGGHFDVIIEPRGGDARSVTVRTRESQLHVLPKSSNACEISGHPYSREANS